MSRVIFCTNSLPFSRFIHWWTGGYSHAALILDNGKWLDSRFFGGVRERKETQHLLEFEIIELPFDIETEMRYSLGSGYNFKGIISQFFHFKWSSPGRKFCSQAILSACRLSGHQICDIGREDKTTPQHARDLLKAYIRGLHDKSQPKAN